MLQNIRDNSQSWVVKVIIATIVVAFVFVGVITVVDLTGGSADTVATVNGEEISKQSLQRTTYFLKQGQFGQLPDEFLNEYALNQLIDQELLNQLAEKKQLHVSDTTIDRMIVKNPLFFNESGQFDEDLFRRFLGGIALSPQGYKAQLRTQLQNQQMQKAYTLSAFVLPNEINKSSALINQTRDFSYVIFSLDDLDETVTVTEQEITAYYDENPTRFMSLEKVSVNYIELNASQLVDAKTVSDDEINQRYEQMVAELSNPANQQRRASHILLEVTDKMTESDAVEKLKMLKVQLETGESFVELAKQHSQDESSASDGGDIGLLKKSEAPDPAFAETLFALTGNQVSEPVKTQFGYHLIKLTDIVKPEIPALEQVRSKITQDVSQQKVSEQFISIAEEIRDLTFSSSDLQDAATTLSLEIKSTELFNRAGGEGIAANKGVIEAAFSDVVLSGTENSKVIEVDNEHLVVLHLKEHQPKKLKSIDIVREEITESLIKQKQQVLLADKVQKIKSGLDDKAEGEGAELDQQSLAWQTVQAAKRNQADLDPQVLSVAFGLSKSLVNEYHSATLNDGREVLLVLKAVSEKAQDGSETIESENFQNQLVNENGIRIFQIVLAQARKAAEINTLLDQNDSE